LDNRQGQQVRQCFPCEIGQTKEIQQRINSIGEEAEASPHKEKIVKGKEVSFQSKLKKVIRVRRTAT